MFVMIKKKTFIEVWLLRFKHNPCHKSYNCFNSSRWTGRNWWWDGKIVHAFEKSKPVSNGRAKTIIKMGITNLLYKALQKPDAQW